MKSIEGPHFVYEDAPSLFLGRRGNGPLDVVWDTNVLIDYLEYGRALWDGKELTMISDENYRADVDALGLLINLWMRRDIRFHVLQRSVTDAKRPLALDRQAARQRALDQIAAALSLDMWADLRQDQATAGSAPPALATLPDGLDRELVADALMMGAHVFLTRDEEVLLRVEDVRPHRLLLASPLDLLEELAACGALFAVLRPETVYWPLPDLQRMSHLIQALGSI